VVEFLIKPRKRMGEYDNAEKFSGENRDELEIHIPKEGL
jgi:hypothetical protein